VELKVLENTYTTLSLLQIELKEYSFIAPVLSEIDKCLDYVRIDIESKAKSIGETWEFYHDLITQAVAERKEGISRNKMIGVPTNSNTQRVIPKVKQFAKGLLQRVQESVSRDFFPKTIEGLNFLINYLEKSEKH